jgi:UDP-N-acetylmuramyl pentapeptide phosphotransferase/UDP-N-acetylglucosamine-1-phosphate transferase
MHISYSILLVFFISLIVAALMHQPVLYFAQKHNIYDNPEARKLQRTPVPVMGGFVVFFGAMAGSLSYWFKYDCSDIIPVQVAMLIMLIVGAWDDMKNISPKLKFVIEIIVVTVLMIVNNYPVNDLHGLWGMYEISPWIAWPLSIIGCVGIINAINMIDGIDGLSSGICIMIFSIYSWWFFITEDFVRAALGVSIVGGLIPFFVMNVFGNKSKMFIGDAGTLMLGMAICDMVLAMLTHDAPVTKRLIKPEFSRIAFALAVLAIPVFDTIRVMFGRISRGESPFTPDKTHLHHAFIDYGFHHLETSLLEIILNMMVVLVFAVIYFSHLSMQWQLYGVILAGIAVCFGLYYMLGRRKRIVDRAQKAKQKAIDEGKDVNDC